jgi:hypothetical protein
MSLSGRSTKVFVFDVPPWFIRVILVLWWILLHHTRCINLLNL